MGADADLVVWDPSATRTISAKTHHQNIDFNIFEGRTVSGVATHTISQGKLVYKDGQLNVEEGAGRYIERPTYPSDFSALEKLKEANKPEPIRRAVCQEISLAD